LPREQLLKNSEEATGGHFRLIMKPTWSCRIDGITEVIFLQGGRKHEKGYDLKFKGVKIVNFTF
jgi:hypothetical protein